MHVYRCAHSHARVHACKRLPARAAFAARLFVGGDIWGVGAEALACVALSGAVGECEAFGQAKGAQRDFADLQDIFDRVQPPLTPAEQQSATRRACLNAYGVLYGKRSRKNDEAVAAVDAAMARGATLGEVVCALENA